ncbi:hypothetical protein DIPPA_02263 [Diplonema papillatum]|nr:hypothetical protein DIPPA_02263 [Diplonema papillatum]
MHSRGSLAKALRASGLYEAYAGALEEAQVFDLETLEALTDDDWCELVPSDHHRQQFAEVVQRLRASHHRRHHAATPPSHPTKQPPPSPNTLVPAIPTPKRNNPFPHIKETGSFKPETV